MQAPVSIIKTKHIFIMFDVTFINKIIQVYSNLVINLQNSYMPNFVVTCMCNYYSRTVRQGK